MRKLFTLFLILSSLISKSQTSYSGSMDSSVKITANVAGAPRTIIVPSLLASRLTITKYTTDSTTMMALINAKAALSHTHVISDVTGLSSSLSGKLDVSTAASTYVPIARTITINGITFDLSTNRTWTIAGGTTDTIPLHNEVFNAYNDISAVGSNGIQLIKPNGLKDTVQFNSTALRVVTTTGSSGAATLTGDSLNIPIYTTSTNRADSIKIVGGSYYMPLRFDTASKTIQVTYNSTTYTFSSGASLTQLSTPGSFTAGTPTSTTVPLTWADISNETGYEIYRNTTNSQGSATLINSPAANATSYTATGLTASTSYYFWLRGINGTTYSNSNYASTTATTTSGGGSYTNTEASDYIARVSTAGYSATTTEKVAIDTFVSKAKRNGYWSKLYLLYNFTIGTASGPACTNLISSSYAGTVTGTVTFNGSSATSNGTDGYVNSTLTPSTSGLTLNSTAFGCWFATGGALTGKADIGARSSNTSIIYMNANNNDGRFYISHYYQGAGSAFNATRTLQANDLYVASRLANNNSVLYINATSFASSATVDASPSLPSQPVYILAYNNAGVVNDISTHGQKMAFVASGFTQTDVANLYADYGSFLTTTGK